MAELDQQAEAAAVNEEVEEKGQEVADQFAAADEKGDPEVTPPSVEEVAASIGWTPKDKFSGPEEKWKPADQFIRDGRKAEKNMKRRLDEMSSTLDNVSKTTAAVLEERLREQRQDLAAQYAAAVEKGDPDEAWKISNEIHNLKAPAAERPAPAPETEEWATKNARVLKDPLAAQRAVQLCEPYAKANYAAADQLAAIEPILRREFAHLFDDKPPPVVEPPRTRNSGAPKRGAEAYADMPKVHKEIADDMLDRGVIKDKEMYARNYFAQVAKGQ